MVKVSQCYLPVLFVALVIIPFLCGEENCGDNCKDSFMSNGGMSALWSELLVLARYLRTWALILGSEGVGVLGVV